MMNRVATRRLATRRLSTAVATNLDDVATPKLICSDSGKFSCTILPGWSLFAGKGGFGGMLKAQLARASVQLLPADRRLLSMNTTFLAPASAGDVEITAKVLRNGKAMSYVAAEVAQAGTVLTTAHLAFGTSRAGSQSHPPLPMPSGLPEPVPEPLPETVAPFVPEYFRDRMEVRWASETRLLDGATDPVIRLWMRFREKPVRDCGLFVAMLDAPPPPIWSAFTKPAVCASVTTHMQLLQPAATEEEEEAGHAHPWYLYESRSTHMGGGHSDIQGRLWREDGAMVGLITQHVVDFSAPRAG